MFWGNKKYERAQNGKKSRSGEPLKCCTLLTGEHVETSSPVASVFRRAPLGARQRIKFLKEAEKRLRSKFILHSLVDTHKRHVNHRKRLVALEFLKRKNTLLKFLIRNKKLLLLKIFLFKRRNSSNYNFRNKNTLLVQINFSSIFVKFSKNCKLKSKKIKKPITFYIGFLLFFKSNFNAFQKRIFKLNLELKDVKIYNILRKKCQNVNFCMKYFRTEIKKNILIKNLYFDPKMDNDQERKEEKEAINGNRNKFSAEFL